MNHEIKHYLLLFYQHLQFLIKNKQHQNFLIELHDEELFDKFTKKSTIQRVNYIKNRIITNI